MLETLKKFKLEAKNIQSFNVKIQRSKDRLMLENELLKIFDFLTMKYDNCPIYIYKKYYYNGWCELQVCPVCGEPLGIRIHKKEIKILQTCGNKNCSNIHRKSTNLDRYGTECSIQNEQVKEKTKHTNKIRYGTEIPQQSDVVKNKTINTNRKKYGFDSHTKNEKVKIKKITTNLSKYGCEHVSQSDGVKLKIKQTNIIRYGGHPIKNIDIKNKIQTTNLKKYGNIHSCLNPKIKSKIINSLQRNTIESFEKIGYQVLGINNDLIKLICSTCGEEFEDNRHFLIMRRANNLTICTNCNPYKSQKSNPEVRITEFLNSLGLSIETSNRKVLFGKEIDVFIPSLKIGIEFNGLYWHSDKFKHKNYHQEKKFNACKQGVNLIHIWEDDWISKRNIIEARLRNITKNITNNIFARKCSIIEVDSKISKEFLGLNHIQGQIGATYRFGLIYENTLVSLMTFGVRNNKMEMLRFCNKLNYNIVGGFSKLLKHFKKIYSGVIYSYADLDWSNPNDNVYIKNGFSFVKITEPGYFWVKDNIRYNRHQFQKHKLVEQGFDINKTEEEIMIERGYAKIFNSGNILYFI